jgi:hypothetical protein
LCEAFHVVDRACRGPISTGAIAEARTALASSDQGALYVWMLLAATAQSTRRLLRLAELMIEAAAEAERVRRDREVTTIRIMWAPPPP